MSDAPAVLPWGASAVLVPGLAIAVGSAAMALGGWPTGSPAFMAVLVGQLAAYLTAAVLIVRQPQLPIRTIVLGGALGVAAHAPLVAMPELPARDAIRYVWDARVQRAGLNPYEVRPDDLAVAHLHTDLTRRVDAAWLPTIYPPVAQLYFRLASPQAAALLVAPVIYPWYLAWVAPFAVIAGAITPWAWSLGLLAIYPTWWYATRGASFDVPGHLLALEYAAPAVGVVGGWVAIRWRTSR